jgi:TolB-like protein/Tfp pilus assembly protein PilF
MAPGASSSRQSEGQGPKMSEEVSESGGDQTPTDPPAALHVFISYASQDVGIANAIVETLERHGVSCWIAPRDVKAGALYADAIVRAISGAQALVLVLSQNSVASSHVGKEIERASSKRRPIIALRIDEAPLSPALEYFLGESQWVDARAGGIDAALAKLIAAIRDPPRNALAINPRVISGMSTVKAPAATPRLRRNRLVLPAVCAAVVVALAWLLADKLGISKHVSHEKHAVAASPIASAGVPALSAISEKSIAVLPFVNMSEDKNNEYFSDGLSEELIDMLTKVPDLRVPARTSSFYFKGKQATVADIARALSVSHVLEGSVRKSGKTIRITAQLIRVDNGYHLWSETYDRQLDDVFKIQDEIAGAVVKALKVSLLESATPRTTPTTNTEAYTLYLQAQSIHNHALQLADAQRAVDYLQRALKLDPKFARAWATLAIYRVADWEFFTSGNYQDVGSEARYAAEQALKLDPKLSDAHVALSVVYSLEWNWKAAGGEIHQALALDPGNADAFGVATVVALTQGHFDEGLQLAEKAVLLDPLSASNYGGFAGLSAAHLASGRLAEAEAAYRQALDLSPTASQLHFLLGWALLAGHEPAAALAEMEKETDERYRDVGLALALDALGRTTEADRSLAVAKAQYAGVVEYPIAVVYANRNDLDSAFAWVDRAFEVHDGWVYWVPFDPLLKNLREDARYKALLRKMNLPE